MAKVREKKETADAELGMSIKVSDRVELENIRQLSGIFRLETLNTEGKKNFTVLPKTNVKVDEKNNKLICFVDFAIDTFKEDGKEQKKLAYFESKYLLVYSIKSMEGLTAKDYDAFAKFNAIFNAWPYLREYIQATTARLALPALVLPIYRYGTVFLKPTLDTTSKRKIVSKSK